EVEAVRSEIGEIRLSIGQQRYTVHFLKEWLYHEREVIGGVETTIHQLLFRFLIFLGLSSDVKTSVLFAMTLHLVRDVAELLVRIDFAQQRHIDNAYQHYDGFWQVVLENLHGRSYAVTEVIL
ncbi:hypothetical protein PENTCL1PPCAC_15339, partial [Pristionchus entomophagus]